MNLPPAPPDLDAVAAKEWNDTMSVLHLVGLDTVIDRSSLSAYSRCFRSVANLGRLPNTVAGAQRRTRLVVGKFVSNEDSSP